MKRKLKIVWSCGVRPGCEHRYRWTAWLHGAIAMMLPTLRCVKAGGREKGEAA